MVLLYLAATHYNSVSNSTGSDKAAKVISLPDSSRGSVSSRGSKEHSKSPKDSKKVEDLVARAITEKWPNIQLRALISMTRDNRLIEELWARGPVDPLDLCVLAMHSKTPEQRKAAAERWAVADANNAEPRYILLLERWKTESDKVKLLGEISNIQKLPKLDSYFSDRSLAFDIMLRDSGMSAVNGISPLDANDTRSKAANIMTLLAKYGSELKKSDIDGQEQLAAIGAGLAKQLESKQQLSIIEIQIAITGEFEILKHLDDQTEYGRPGFTVAERKVELEQKSTENMQMQDAVIQSFKSDPNLLQLFNQRVHVLGEYQAYQQIYHLLKTGARSQ